MGQYLRTARVGCISGTYTVVNVKTLQHDTFKDNDYVRHLSNRGKVYVRQILTHRDYDKGDWKR